MPFVNVHPAPGLGEMLPGWFVVPNNPFRPRAVVGVGKGVGMMLPAGFVVPQNPLIDALRTVGMPAGKTASIGYINGIGEISLDSVWQSVQPTVSSITDFVRQHPYLSLGLGVLLLMMVTRRGTRAERLAAKYSAKARYYEELADYKRRYPSYATALTRKASSLASKTAALAKKAGKKREAPRPDYWMDYWSRGY